MARTKLWVILLICVVSSAVLISCNRSTTNVLRVECAEGGYYAVDVTKWWKVMIPGGEGEPAYAVWYYAFTDATIKATAYYANVGSDMPEVPGRAIRLDKYRITWKPTELGLPQIDGVLDAVVELDPEGKTGTDFSFMVMPGVCKDTIAALSALRADPEGEVFYNGSIGARGTLTVYGTDLLTGLEYTADGAINAQFADYVDPNNLH